MMPAVVPWNQIWLRCIINMKTFCIMSFPVTDVLPFHLQLLWNWFWGYVWKMLRALRFFLSCYENITAGSLTKTCCFKRLTKLLPMHSTKVKPERFSCYLQSKLLLSTGVSCYYVIIPVTKWGLLSEEQFPEITSAALSASSSHQLHSL